MYKIRVNAMHFPLKLESNKVFQESFVIVDSYKNRRLLFELLLIFSNLV